MCLVIFLLSSYNEDLIVMVMLNSSVTSGMDSLAATSYNDLQILQEPLFALATDNVHMTSVVGTNDGRIFMAGKDGCLYEMHYQVLFTKTLEYHDCSWFVLEIFGRAAEI